MDKQKQIEEMANIINKTDCAGESCQYVTECIKKGIPFSRINTQLFIDKKHAEALYNAGYRKIPENAVVLTRDEYNELCCSIGVSREEVDRVVDMVEKDTRKETAEKFAERLKEKADMNMCLYGSRIVYVGEIDEICKEITEG